MDDYRHLVYEDKKSLADFFVNDENSLNNIIFEEWLLKRVEIDPFDANHHIYYIKVFNDAYYICTLALLMPIGKRLRLDRLLSKVDRPSIVFPLIHIYLSKLSSKSRSILFLLNQLDTAFKNRSNWQINYDELKVLVSKYDNCVDTGTFSQRQLTSEVLSNLNWCQLTETFNKKKIEEVVRNYARNKDTWDKMIKAIKTSAQKYDYDFGFEDYEEEGFDENGYYMRTIKVPKDPYDHYGNEQLEPLKRAGVFLFCDELITKYDELVLKTQPMDIATEKSSEQLSDNSPNSCFKHKNNYVKDLVKKAIEACQRKKASLALLEVTLYDHGQIKYRNSHLSFLRELVDWGLLPMISQAEKPDIELNKTVNCMRDKAKYLPESGYKTWKDRKKDKLTCERIAKCLDSTMPYIR